MIVADASALVALITRIGGDGAWVADTLTGQAIVAPHHARVETAHSLRRQEHLGRITRAAARAAHEELVALGIEEFPYSPFAPRIWELRHNLTPYDAWYVALAEALDAPLATLDRRLGRADGPRCEFFMP